MDSPFKMGVVLVVVQLFILHGCTEGAPLQGEAVELGDQAAQPEPADAAVPGTSMATFPGAGAGSGSGSGVAWNPSPLVRPYEAHMEPNKERWSQLGGWTKHGETAKHNAQKDIVKADEYLKIKQREKAISEMGCPCPGEKYEDMVENPKKMHELVAMGAAAAAKAAAARRAAAARGSAAGSGSVSGEGEGSGSGDGDIDDVDSESGPDGGNGELDSETFKKMVDKYGKLGPESSWKPSDDKFLKHAGLALKAAETETEVLFKVALPEFKQMRHDNPDFFANGKCKCPDYWTLQDAAALTKKMHQDQEHQYWKLVSEHRKMMDDMSGETERVAAMEAAKAAPDPKLDGPQGPKGIHRAVLKAVRAERPQGM